MYYIALPIPLLLLLLLLLLLVWTQIATNRPSQDVRTDRPEKAAQRLVRSTVCMHHKAVINWRIYIFTPRGAPQGNRQGNIVAL